MRVLALLLAAMLLSPSSEPPRQGYPDPPLKTCWKVTTKTCTSCNLEGYCDDECKKDTNGPFSTCIVDEETCPNGALCDADLGSGEC